MKIRNFVINTGKLLFGSLKSLVLIIFAGIILCGCMLRNDTNDVIKITSENISDGKIKKSKVLSLDTGLNFLKSGNIDSAIGFFKEYEEFYTNNPKFYSYFGQALFKKGLYKESSKVFKKSLALNNKQYGLYLDIAYACEKANLPTEATENFINYVFKSNNYSKNTEIRDELNKIARPQIGNGIIGKFFVTDKAEISKNTAIGIKQAFFPETSAIFASVDLINAEKSDKIQIKWVFVTDKNEYIPVNSSEFSFSGSKTVLSSIKSPISGWVAGKYEMQVFLNNIKNSSLQFYVF